MKKGGSKKAAQPRPRQSSGSSSSSGSSGSSKDSWSSLLQDVTRLAAARPAALLTGTQLPDVVSRIQQQLLDTQQGPDTDAAIFKVCSEFMALLSKLLAARKRAREWRQADYSGRVCSVLSASAWLLSACWRRAFTHRHVAETDAAAAACVQQAQALLVSRVAVAEQELVQLLSAQLEQQQGTTTPTAQQQQQELTTLAVHLLGWHVLAGDGRCDTLTAATPLADASVQHAADLWVLVAQTVTGDSPTLFHVSVLAQAAYYVCKTLRSLIRAGSQQSALGGPAVLRVCLALVLALGHAVWHSSQGGSSSSSSSSASNATVSSSPHCWTQQQLADATLQVWEAAGFPRGAFAAFAGAVQQALPSFRITLESARLSGCTLPPTDSALELQAFTLALQVFSEVQSSLVARDGLNLAPDSQRMLHTFDSLSRQQQQLMLQQHAWPLPTLLLQTAVVVGRADAVLISSTAAAAIGAARTWTMPGLRAAAEAAAAAAGSSSSALPLSQLLEPLLDAWLLLVGQQMLQQLRSLTSGAAANPAAAAAEAAALTVLDSLSSLVTLLHSLAAVDSLPAWCGKLPSILLLLDMVHRRVLPLAISSSSRIRDSAAALLAETDALLQLSDQDLSDGLRPLAQALPMQSEQQPVLLQQAFALSISRLKLLRRWQQKGSLVKVTCDMNAAASVALVCTCVRAQVSALPPTASLAEARVLLAPWLLLLGLHLQAAGVQLQLWGEQAAARLEGQPAASSSSSAAGGNVPAGDLPGRPLDVQQLLVEAEGLWRGCTELLECLCDHLVQPWAGSNCTESSAASGSSSSGSSSNQPAAAGPQPPGSCSLAQQQLGASSCAAAAASNCAQAASAAASTSAEGSSAAAAATAAVYGDLRAEFEALSDMDKSSMQHYLRAFGAATGVAQGRLQHLGMQTTAADYVRDLSGRVVQDLAAQLVQFGSRLCAQLPVPWLCNNVACTNLAGVCELQLVGGKGKVCGSCRTARYCSRACQAAHWEQHRPVCKQMAAAAAPAGGDGATCCVC